MNKFAHGMMFVGLCSLTALASASDQPLRISQVYGAGGNSGAIYNQDYIELFNMSGDDVDISGWSLQYGSASGDNATGFGTCSNCTVVLPEGSIVASCGYFLVGMATGTNGSALPTLDASGAMNMSGSSGKVALLSTDLAAGACPPGSPDLVDLVGYGSANCFENAPAPGLSASTAAFRGTGGVADTDDNAADFAIDVPAPRNSATETNPSCVTVSAQPATWGTLKAMYR